MEFDRYRQLVGGRFAAQQMTPMGAALYYEERFEAKWIFTKLKQFSFLAQAEQATAEQLARYSAQCLEYALSGAPGLPRGLQNGVVSFSVLAAPEVTEDAVAFACSRPKKHFAAFEVPVLADLTAGRLYYYDKTALWGAVYYKYFRQYIEKSFGF